MKKELFKGGGHHGGNQEACFRKTYGTDFKEKFNGYFWAQKWPIYPILGPIRIQDHRFCSLFNICDQVKFQKNLMDRF